MTAPGAVPTTTEATLDHLSLHALRLLSMAVVQKAISGYLDPLVPRGAPYPRPDGIDIRCRVARGAYVLTDPPVGAPVVILIGTGSEVASCLDAYERLAAEGIATRVAAEKTPTSGWARYIGLDSAVLGMTSFGSSVLSAALQQKADLAADLVVTAAKDQVLRVRGA